MYLLYIISTARLRHTDRSPHYTLHYICFQLLGVQCSGEAGGECKVEYTPMGNVSYTMRGTSSVDPVRMDGGSYTVPHLLTPEDSFAGQPTRLPSLEEADMYDNYGT
uniref:Uncharacterized protein n=1 Tax=Eutreptiella gymnastica TaxID=73025 RepID=A0A7S1J387_9EUGL|mmetsp:Transcript_62645/g.111692  ORF Transcript_62645/g.111692 Transcript_62645/m.111692 type:complete len:107 (+) Transcript_62645:1373-1693(+)